MLTIGAQCVRSIDFMTLFVHSKYYKKDETTNSDKPVNHGEPYRDGTAGEVATDHDEATQCGNNKEDGAFYRFGLIASDIIEQETEARGGKQAM